MWILKTSIHASSMWTTADSILCLQTTLCHRRPSCSHHSAADNSLVSCIVLISIHCNVVLSNSSCLYHPAVSEAIVVSGCPSTAFIHSFIQTGLVITWLMKILLRYLMNSLNIFDKTDMQYLLAPTDDLIRFRKSNVNVTTGRRDGKGVHVNAGVSKSIFHS